MRIKSIILIGILCTCGTYFYTIFLSANVLIDQPACKMVIPYGSSLSSLKHQLVIHGYIKDIDYFELAARPLRFGAKVLPGNYELKPNMNNLSIIRMLKGGLQKPVKITLYDVNNQAQLADQITRKIGLTATEFRKILDDTEFIGKYGFNLDNIMSMFIPNTYKVYWTITAKKLFETMYRAYLNFWNTERLAKAAQLKMSPIEVSILASIVQKESNKRSEAPIIAGVYINRLKRNMRLESCPTLVHILSKKGIKRVLKKDLWIASPYNTYRRKGLPPGPITAPPITVIDAVLNYQRHNYLYFSAKEDLSGYHYFTDNYNEHLRNRRKYQRMLNRNKLLR